MTPTYLLALLVTTAPLAAQAPVRVDETVSGALHESDARGGLGPRCDACAYRPEVVPSPRRGPAGGVRPGESVRGALDDADDPGAGGFEAHYVVRGPRGSRFTAFVDADAFGPRVQSGTGAEQGVCVPSDGDGGEGSDAMPAGAFTHGIRAHRLVRTARGAGAGADRLRLVTGTAPAGDATPRPGNDALPGGARAVRAGDVVEGVLGEARMEGRRYVDYLYTGEAGELVTFEVSSTAFDAGVLIGRGVPFAVLGGGQDGGEGSDALLYAALPARGTYVIRVVSAVPDGEGAYRLRVSSDRSRGGCGAHG